MTVSPSVDLATSLLLSTAGGAQPVAALDPVPAPSEVTPGWLGFGFFLALCVLTVLLWLSMRKQLRKIDFDDGSERSGRSTASRTDHTAGRPADGPAASAAEPSASDRT